MWKILFFSSFFVRIWKFIIFSHLCSKQRFRVLVINCLKYPIAMLLNRYIKIMYIPTNPISSCIKWFWQGVNYIDMLMWWLNFFFIGLYQGNINTSVSTRISHNWHLVTMHRKIISSKVKTQVSHTW